MDPPPPSLKNLDLGIVLNRNEHRIIVEIDIIS